MSKHYISAVVCNTSGGTICHYLKKFDSKATFEEWMDYMSPANGGHCEVVKWWWDNPPCDELQKLKEQFADSWITTHKVL
jgi:hypothetical protein